jgi:hypothetical protein
MRRNAAEDAEKFHRRLLLLVIFIADVIALRFLFLFPRSPRPFSATSAITS